MATTPAPAKGVTRPGSTDLASQIADIRKRRQQKKAPAKGQPAKGAPAVDPYGGRGEDPTAVTGPLTPRQLDTEAAAAARTKYQPQENAIAGEQRVSGQQQTNISNWFQQYQDAVTKAQGQSAAYDAGVQAAVQSRADQAGTADPNATPEAQQAAKARKTSGDSFGAMLAAQGSAHNTYFADKGRIGAGEAAQQHVNETGRNAALGQALRDLLGQKGDFLTQYKADARTSERKSALEQKAFGLDVTNSEADRKLKEALATQDATDKKASRAVSRKNTRDRITATQNTATAKTEADAGKVNQYGYTNAEWARHSPEWRQRQMKKTKDGGGKGGPTDASIRTTREKSQKALGRIDQVQGRWDALASSPKPTGAVDDNGHAVTNKDGTPQTRKATEAEIRAQLSKEGFTPNEIHLMRMKQWGPAEIQMAHQLGIRVPRDKIAPKRDITQGTGNPDSAGGTGLG